MACQLSEFANKNLSNQQDSCPFSIYSYSLPKIFWLYIKIDRCDGDKERGSSITFEEVLPCRRVYKIGMRRWRNPTPSFSFTVLSWQRGIRTRITKGPTTRSPLHHSVNVDVDLVAQNGCRCLWDYTVHVFGIQSCHGSLYLFIWA